MKIFYIVQGERRFFRICFHWLCNNHPEAAKRNFKYIINFGRIDDLYCMVDTPLENDMFTFLKELIEEQKD
jgi:hypothetical protein